MTPHLYVVESDEGTRDQLVQLLSEQLDLPVRAFDSGDRFLDALDELEPGVVLIAHGIQGVTGLAILDALSGEAGRMSAIMTNCDGQVQLAVQAMRAGAVDLVEKPYEPARLIEAVGIALAVLDRKRREYLRVEDAKARLARLSMREREVLSALVEGQTNKVIAQTLNLSPKTVEIHRAKLMDKLEARSLSQVLRLAFEATLRPAA